MENEDGGGFMITIFGEKKNEPENNEPKSDLDRIIDNQTEFEKNCGIIISQPKKESQDLTEYKTQQIDVWQLLIASLIKVSKGQKKISLGKLINDITKIEILIKENSN
jgi:hypothetical protein